MNTHFSEGKLSEPLYGATPVQAVVRFIRKYARFSGYASRSEFWWTYLALTVVAFISSIITRTTNADGGMNAFGLVGVNGLFLLVIIVPYLALCWRRFHDAGFSGAMFFLILIPFVGLLIFLVFMALPTNPEKRRAEWRDTRGD